MTNQNEKQIAEKIKSSYAEKSVHETKLEELRRLDSQVKMPAKVFAYTYGSAGSLILGTGMSLAMKIIGATVATLMPVGIVVGVLGIAIVATTYPIYKKILNKRKAKFSKAIIAKSEELLNSKGE